ncbi:MAG: threonine/serine exporter family protein [Negativicutes bacterium]|nr:threonine/serine exporter family protein [Negativicutes bacterium]
MDQWSSRFQLPMLAGELLLVNGAEIFRVEQTMERMAYALGAERADTLAVLSGIQASFTVHNQVYTYVRRIHSRRTGLGIIIEINSISRRFCSAEITFDEAEASLQKLATAPTHRSPLRKALASAFGTLSFSVLFQLRGPFPLCYATINGFLASYLTDLFAFWRLPDFISTYCTSFCLTVLTFLYPSLTGGDMDRVLLASLIFLLPGVPLTVSVRELTNGDLLSGTTRLTEAVITLITIAAGVYTVFTLFSRRLPL